MREAIRTQNLPLDIHLAPDGQEAMEFIERAETDPNSPCPHLMLLDINLPRADGFEVLRRVRASEKCGHIPVVVVSSSDSPDDRNLAAQLGAGYFRKPPSYAEYLKLGLVLKALIETREK